MKGIKKILLIALGVVVIGLGSFFLWISNGLSEGENVTIQGIDLSEISDGIYTGNYSHGRWSNKLTVSIKDHAITAISIDKDVTFVMAVNSDKIFQSVIAAQNTTVDAVSGATVTSKAYLKAIENALRPQ